MGDEITSPAVLISMLVELRQQNRQLADELSTAQMLLRALQAAPALEPLEDGAVERPSSSVPRESQAVVLAD